jgi:hypothetical protein
MLGGLRFCRPPDGGFRGGFVRYYTKRFFGLWFMKQWSAKLLPRPSAPYEGMTLDGIRNAVKRFRSSSFHNGLSRAYTTCNLAKLKEEILSRYRLQYHVKLKT